ncbi:helix-hairpin-helix domain-containing protein [Clostridium sp.]|uniref:helix-hairpin-helix domain-containing protein n=1 Tax=Clostridium sp. TaxID=1506 RepID=UPI002A911F09|nr:helix-hairpin-helix domain-containing protein [Clostridium sp.]MDY6011897.1 helix-hairpin-helix domain-containing protein [Clostridium sp.]
MDAKKKSIGLIIIAVIIGGGLLINYIVSGRDSLNKNNNDNIFVEEENEELEENSKENNKQSSSNVKGQGSGEIIELKDNRIVVDIKGEVKNQGVYYLNEGSIVEDLIREAGGITDKASLDLVNRAEKLTNNKCIIIPSKEESNEIKGPQSNNIASMPSSMASTNSDDGNEIININTASESELVKINGIGPAKAKAIISYREENGGFGSIEDIKNVSGIGEGTFLKIKDYISV